MHHPLVAVLKMVLVEIWCNRAPEVVLYEPCFPGKLFQSAQFMAMQAWLIICWVLPTTSSVHLCSTSQTHSWHKLVKFLGQLPQICCSVSALDNHVTLALACSFTASHLAVACLICVYALSPLACNLWVLGVYIR